MEAHFTQDRDLAAQNFWVVIIGLMHVENDVGNEPWLRVYFFKNFLDDLPVQILSRDLLN